MPHNSGYGPRFSIRVGYPSYTDNSDLWVIFPILSLEDLSSIRRPNTYDSYCIKREKAFFNSILYVPLCLV